MKIAVVGDYGIDRYENLGMEKPGGIAFNFAYNLLKANTVSLISVVGSDRAGTQLKKIAKETGLNTSHLKTINGKTPIQLITLNKGERKFFGYFEGVLKKWKLRKQDLDQITNSDLVFVPLSDGLEQIFNRIKRLKCKTTKATDFSQDYEFADFDEKENLITKNSKYFDLIFIGGSKKQENQIKKLSSTYPEKVFILTLGKDGSIAYRNTKKFVQKSTKVNVCDTTGCGDAFQAAFVSSYLKKDDIKNSLLVGTKNALKVIKIIGSTNLNLELN